MESQDSSTEALKAKQPAPVVLPPPRRAKNRKILAMGLIVVLVVAAGIFYYVRYLAPYESTDDAFIDGNITSVSTRVPGQVARLLVSDNQEVKVGQLMLELDPRDYQTSALQARADLAAAHARFEQSLADVQAAESRVAAARATASAAQSEAQRTSDDLMRYHAVESRAVSKSALDPMALT